MRTWTIWICQVDKCGEKIALEWEEGDEVACPIHGPLMGEDHGSLARPLDIMVVEKWNVDRVEERVRSLEGRLARIREAADW